MYKLIYGDCIKVMQKMKSNCIDLVITSPPYDDLRLYDNSLKWNFNIFKQVADSLYRILKEGGVIVWIVGDKTINGSESLNSFKQALYFKKIGLKLHDTMIYNKGSCPFPDKKRYYNTFEYMFIVVKGNIKTYNLISDKLNKRYGENIKGTTLRQKNGNLIKTSSEKNNINRKIKKFGIRNNIWHYSPGYIKSTKDKEVFKHPTIFSEELVKDHVLSWSNENDIILDPFMGSGTTGKIALLNNRKFIGIEKVKEYYLLSKRRIKKIYRIINNLNKNNCKKP